MYMPPFRNLTNKPGVSYDETKTSILFAEDFNNLALAVSRLFYNLMSLASGSILGYTSGRYYDNSVTSSQYITCNTTDDSFFLVPFLASRDFSIDLLGVSVTATDADRELRFCIYSHGDNGLPHDLLYSSSSISAPETGFISTSLDFTFEAGKLYWLGLHTNIGLSVLGLDRSSVPSLGLSSAIDESILNSFITWPSFSSPFPSADPVTLSDLNSAYESPSIRFRVA